MDIFELLENHRAELTEKSIFFIETSDRVDSADLGSFDNARQFNEFIEYIEK